MTMHNNTCHIELIAMAFFYKVHIAICFENQTYMTFGNITDPLCIIYMKKKGEYALVLTPKEDLTHLYKHHHYLRPLDSISNYKIDELYGIYHRLKLPSLSNKIKKQDLYQIITEYLCKSNKID